MHPILQVAGVFHIWSYIPLCTIFAQQFNGDVFRSKFHDPKLQRPLQSRTLQLISLAIHGGYQKTLQGPQPPGPAGVGLAIQFRIIQKGPFSEVLHSFTQFSRKQVIQHPLDNSVGLYR
ncbi:hypothetical protein O181_080117 [Austropuccinia psidii MF-1]|uniref:Uncharacterized protein n=1 Tax=Austropuccinia psidii MF-1 TaxID=1389203 RepID=A0A9Q3IH56_9BASI|nr:hypothetical protein [Austropuccinia psidii MF-1]